MLNLKKVSINLAGFLAVTLCALCVRAQEDPLGIQIRNRVLAGVEKPALILIANLPLQDISVKITRQDGRVQKFTKKLIKMSHQQEVIINHPANVDHADYKAEIRYKGLKEPIMIEFDVVSVRPMKLNITKETVDLSQGRITFTTDSPVVKVDLLVLGENGSRIADISKEFKEAVAPGGQIEVSFTPTGDSITLVRLTAHDPYGFYNGIEMSPFFIEIPHEEITFEFGKADILDEEQPKLARTLERVHEALAKFGNEFQARLYVAGYTDTVGSRESNQELSDKRANAIAKWFKANGAKVKICAQGFGEDSLAVLTPDETPEPRNRRTLHVLANQPPPVGRLFPRSNWKCH
ncbi:MAG: OmpA family protein [Myxococcota bacterium]|nr:OmpA family protein [Myxococcota bacterium]HQL56548.1 OmpA family protein [Myxococcota bacterium]